MSILLILKTHFKYLQWSGRHDGIVTSCNFSNNGKMAVSGSDLDNTVKVWDVNSGLVIAQTAGMVYLYSSVTTKVVREC